MEFALLAPLIFMLIFGMITGGLALSHKNSMSNATREGSRLGATLPVSDAWASDVRARVVQVASGDLTPGQVCVELTGSEPAVATGNAGGCESWDKPADPAGADGCVVKVWSRRTAVLNVIIWTRDLTLDVSSVARYEREGSGGC